MQRLIKAAEALLMLHCVMGTCFPEEHVEDDPHLSETDENGRVWYKDWLELRDAIKEAKGEGSEVSIQSRSVG